MKSSLVLTYVHNNICKWKYIPCYGTFKTYLVIYNRNSIIWNMYNLPIPLNYDAV